MSLINDALIKAQRERAQPRGTNLYRTPGFRPGYLQPVPVKSLTFVWVSASLVAVLLLGGIWYLRSRPASLTPAAVAGPTANPSPTNVSSTPPAVASVPEREAPDFPAAPVAAPLRITQSDYELAGMSAVGSTTLLSVVRRSDKRGFWVPVGKTVGEVTAVSYDAASDRAVIRVNGSLQTIGLRNVGSPTVPAE